MSERNGGRERASKIVEAKANKKIRENSKRESRVGTNIFKDLKFSYL